jgi:anaerobic magnesium-protoporphyrin IX monomethyl ester cyclase
VWKLVAGTKAETIKDEGTLELMALAGCRYISISPETGSARVLKLINKPFKTDHARKLVAKMRDLGIRSQACFVLGFPGETDEDRRLTWQLAKELTLGGLDEIALFIISPVPGSAIFPLFVGYASLSNLNFTPVWREDYPRLRDFRLRLYLAFLAWKTLRYPLRVLRQAWNFALRRFETKMEMVPFKALVWKSVELRSRRAFGSSRQAGRLGVGDERKCSQA